MTGNGGDNRENYFKEQRRALTVVAHALRQRIGPVGAAGLLIGCANGILIDELGEMAARNYLGAAVRDLDGTGGRGAEADA